MSKGVIGIATGNLGEISETFVFRHVIKLNNGKTAVICKSIDDRIEVPKIPIYKISRPKAYYWPFPFRKSFFGINLLLRGHQGALDRNQRDRIIKFIKKSHIEVILAEFGHIGCIMVPIAKEAGIPIYTYFRGFDASKSLQSWKSRYSYRRLINKVDGIFAVSSHLLKNLEGIGVSSPNSYVIPSGVDTNLFVPREKDSTYLVSVGRFVEKKAPDITVRAFAEVSKKYPKLRLEMIGDGPLLDNCKQVAISLGVADKIYFPGALSHEVIQEKLSRAIIFLLHSVTTKGGETEGLPSVIQEALASGAVVVSTKHGGIPEAIEHGVNGYLVEENNLSEYITMIDELICNSEIRNRMAINGREVAEKKYDSKTLLTKIESILL